MKQTKCFILTLLFGGMLFSGCKDTISEITADIQEPVSTTQDSHKGINVRDGYLVFNKKNTLENYLQIVSDNLYNDSDLKSAASVEIKGFISSAERMAQSKLKSSDGSGDIYTEMQSSLIPDELLHYAIDTLNRVAINDTIYQITSFGTLIYHQEDMVEVNLFSETLPDGIFNYDNQIDSVTYTYGKIKLIDTYQHVANRHYDDNTILSCFMDDGDDQIISQPSLKAVVYNKNPKYTSKYNLNTFKVKGGVFNNNRRSHYFDSNTRVRARLWDFNWGIYKAAGFTGKFQKKKAKTIRVRKYGFFGPKRTITLYTYWSSTINKEMAIGIDRFEGYYEYNDFGLSNDKNGFSVSYNHHKSFSNGIAKIARIGINELFSDVVGWANRGQLYNSSLKFNLPIIGNTNLLREAYNRGTDEILSEIRSKTEDGITYFAPTRYLKSDQELYPNRKYISYIGVKNYSYRSHISIMLGLPSFGIPAPNKFFVKDAYIFAAAKYNGKWKGVRLHF